ncbi:MAG: hypothetical protein PVH00_02915 [Gemmatimonadota bacterium]|jgi:hypothetical protein
MNHYPSPWHPENEVERLLCSLAGVVSARVVANPLGRLEEIHILASPMLSAKQIVRNVQSALSAGLGIIVDRRIVSVAQIRRDALEPFEAGPAAPAEESGNDAAAPAPAPEPLARHDRVVFLGWEAEGGSRASTECTVRLLRDDDVVTGRGAGAGSAAGRVQAGARAAFDALTAALDEDALTLEGATVVETHGKRFVLVAARAATGRDAPSLTGVAPLGRSPEEAAVLASLQAANRWIGLDA